MGNPAPEAHILTSELAPPLSFNGTFPWSQSEIQRLYNTYGKQEKETLLMLFPNRTWQAILTKASSLKIKINAPWTPYEDLLLLEMLDFGLNYRVMLNFLPHRTILALRTRVYKIRKGVV